MAERGDLGAQGEDVVPCEHGIHLEQGHTMLLPGEH